MPVASTFPVEYPGIVRPDHAPRMDALGLTDGFQRTVIGWGRRVRGMEDPTRQKTESRGDRGRATHERPARDQPAVARSRAGIRFHENVPSWLELGIR